MSIEGLREYPFEAKSGRWVSKDMAGKSEFVIHLLDLLADFGPVEAKALFGGYGIGKRNRMFAIVIDEALFFKADAETKGDFEVRGLRPFTYQRKNREISLSYYQAPEEVLEDPGEMRKWAEKAYAAALRAPVKKSRGRRGGAGAAENGK